MRRDAAVSRNRAVGWGLAVAGYLAAQWLAFALTIEPENVSVFWPPAGVMLAVFLLAPGRDRLPLAGLFFLATLVANWLVGRDYVFNIALSIADVLIGLVGARIYERYAGWRSPLDGLHPLCALFASGIVSALLSASIGAALIHAAFGASYWGVWAVWAAAMLFGIVLVTPAIMAWRLKLPDRMHMPAIIESSLLFALVLLLSTSVFLELWGMHDPPLIAAFAPAPFFVWAGARRTPVEVTTLLLLVTVIAVWGTTHGQGPVEDIHVALFSNAGPAANRVLWVQAYLGLIVMSALLMTAAMAERASSAHATRERESVLRSIIDTSPDGIVTIDEHGLIESFSASAEHIFAYKAAEVIGRNVSYLMPSPYREHHDGYIARYLQTGERRIIGFKRVVRGRRKDGETFPMELAVGEAVVGGRRVFTGFVHDITRRQEAERRLSELQIELLHVSRLSDMGQLAASLAHELNQPLTAIMNYVQAMRHLLGQDAGARRPKVEDIMEKVVAQAARAGQVIRRLRSFVAKGTVEARRENVNRLIEEANALALVGTKEQRIHTTLKLGRQLQPVSVDRVQIQQVLVNLIRNAIEAMASSDRRELTIETSGDSNGFIRVTVSDTGPGLTQDVLDKLFQPFVTTKPEGMGIGLSICKSIIEAHGGSLWHEARPIGGAVFVFTLPEAGKS